MVIHESSFKSEDRQALQKAFSLPLEYDAMLYGSSAVPNLTNPRYTLAAQGITSTGTDGVDILYKTQKCLRVDQASCIKNGTLLQYTVNGLDRAIQAHIQSMYATFKMNGSLPDLRTRQWELMWNLKPDIVGGLSQMNVAYHQYVLSVYQSTLNIQIVGLVLSLVLMIFFYFFMLRPYLKELTKCRKRIAYLLSQLPPELDVESMVRKAVANTISGPAAKGDLDPSMRSSMSSSIGGSSMGSEQSFG
jgi:hypothetical protein